MDPMQTLLNYANHYVCLVEYFDGNDIVYTFVTRSSRLYKEDKKFKFYDLLKQRNVNIENVVNTRILFPSTVSSFKILKGEYKDVELDDHFKNHEEFLVELKAKNKKNINENLKSWQLMDYYDLKEECIEKLYFTPESSKREELLNEMKSRLKYLQTVVDGGVMSKLLSILEISEEKIFVEDAKLVETCKEKWKGVINFYINKAYRKLDEELCTISSEDDKEDLRTEVEEIKKMISDISINIDHVDFKTPADVASYWPELLRPAPNYVIIKK